jgi:NAD(P)-dependent dehydrogenase (short-subunit alcohol dehydrogenase family)
MLPYWAFRTARPPLARDLVCCGTALLAICSWLFPDLNDLLHLSICALCATAIVGLKWLLSPPDRRVPERFFNTPRRFFLTGSASGMSQHLAQALLAKGHYVCATDVDWAKLQLAFGDWESAPRLMLLKLDVRDHLAWDIALQRIVDAWGGVDILLNVAGILCPHHIQVVAGICWHATDHPMWPCRDWHAALLPADGVKETHQRSLTPTAVNTACLQEATIDEINLQLDVNIKGVAFGTRAAAKCMARHGSGGEDPLGWRVRPERWIERHIVAQVGTL